MRGGGDGLEMLEVEFCEWLGLWEVQGLGFKVWSLEENIKGLFFLEGQIKGLVNREKN